MIERSTERRRDLDRRVARKIHKMEREEKRRMDNAMVLDEIGPYNMFFTSTDTVEMIQWRYTERENAIRRGSHGRTSNVADRNAVKQKKQTKAMDKMRPPDENAYGSVKTPVPNMKFTKKLKATKGL